MDPFCQVRINHNIGIALSKGTNVASKAAQKLHGKKEAAYLKFLETRLTVYV